MTDRILKRALDGERLSLEEGEALFHAKDLTALGFVADSLRRKHHPEPVVTYVVDRNINYTNICVSECLFCAFHRRPTDPDAYVLSREELFAKIEELASLGGTQILMQGGLHPDLRLDYYCEMLRSIKEHFAIHIHAFSPPEIIHFARLEGITITKVLRRLHEAGLDTIPGGGAEILVQRVRDRISPRKCTADEWVTVMREAHTMGIRTTATMMFGHVESPEDRIEHLRRVRELQDETGGFTAFIPWTFQPRVAAHLSPGTDERLHPSPLPPGEERCRGTPCGLPFGRGQAPPLHEDGAIVEGWGEGRDSMRCPEDPKPDLPPRPAGGHDYLKTLAICRTFLDNFSNIQASWVTQGAKVAQVALRFGANDLGSTMIEENVVRAAGMQFCMTIAEMRRLISEAGFEPVQRNCYYEPVGRPNVW